MADRNGNSFFTATSTPYEISDVISTLKSGKLLGPNSIPMKILKSLSSQISSPLSQIINESFQSGVFPDKLKLAKVIPQKIGLKSSYIFVNNGSFIDQNPKFYFPLRVRLCLR